MKNNEKEIAFDIPNNVGFYDMKHTKGLISAGMKDALLKLAKTIRKFLIPLSPANGTVEDSKEELSPSDLEVQGIEKITIPSNVINMKKIRNLVRS